MRGCLLSLGTALLVGCGAAEAPPPAGLASGTAAFGATAARNAALMQGERRMVVDLTRRFAAEVPARITFPFDSARLTADARAALDAQAAWITRHPGIRFRVYGHTDGVGSRAYNERLGRARAEAAVARLVARGVDRSRLQAVVSFGETRPIVSTEGRARRNRRTVTEVSGFARGGGMTFDGRYMAEVYRQYVESARPGRDQVFELEGGGGQ